MTFSERVTDVKRSTSKKSRIFKSPLKQMKKIFKRMQHNHQQQRFQQPSTEDSIGKNVLASDADYEHLPQTASSKDSKIKSAVVSGAETQYHPSLATSEERKSKDAVVSDAEKVYDTLPQTIPIKDSRRKNASPPDTEDQYQQPSLSTPRDSKSKEATASCAKAQYLQLLVSPEESSGTHNSADSGPRDEDVTEIGGNSPFEQSGSAFTYVALHDYVRAFQNIDFHQGIIIICSYIL